MLSDTVITETFIAERDLLLRRFSRVRLLWPHRRKPTRLPVPGILQARILEWVAISFSNAWKWKVKVKSLSSVRLFATPWTAAHQAPPSTGLSRQKYWSGVPLPSTRVYLTISFYRWQTEVQRSKVTPLKATQLISGKVRAMLSDLCSRLSLIHCFTRERLWACREHTGLW